MIGFDPVRIRNAAHPWEAVPRDIDANLKFRAQMYRWCSEDPDEASKWLLEWCRKDVYFWFDCLVSTVDPRRHPGHPFRPWITLPFQREELIAGIEEAMGATNESLSSDDSSIGHDLCIKKTRDIGASVALMNCAARRLICFPGTLGVFVSIAETLVDTYEGKSWPEGTENPNTLFGKLDVTIKRLPRFMREDIERSPLWYSKRATGSILEGMSTTGNVTRSGRPHFIICDEFAAWTVNKSIGFLKASAGSSSCRIICSTCQGMDNGFHNVATDPNIPRLELHWTRHPWHSQGLYRVEGDGGVALLDADFWSTKTFGWLKRKLPLLAKKYKNVEDGELLKKVYKFVLESEPPEGLWDGLIRSPYFDQETLRYPMKWMRAQELNCDFIGSGHPFFDPSDLNGYIRKYGTAPIRRGELYLDQLLYSPLEYRDVPTGGYYLWFNPAIVAGKLAPSQSWDYQVGADISGGTGASYSSVCVWNCNTSEKILRYRRNDKRPGRWAEIVYGISKWFHDAPIIFEGAGVGADFGGRLKELGANLYYMREADGITRKKNPGWSFQASMKRDVMERYANALFRGHLINHDIEALSEGFHFQVDVMAKVEHSAAMNSPDVGGSKANHGDDFMADVLSYLGMTERGFARTEKPAVKALEVDPWEKYNAEQRRRKHELMHWA